VEELHSAPKHYICGAGEKTYEEREDDQCCVLANANIGKEGQIPGEERFHPFTIISEKKDADKVFSQMPGIARSNDPLRNDTST